MKPGVSRGAPAWCLSIVALLILLTSCSRFDYDEFRAHHTLPVGSAKPNADNELTVRFLGNTNLLISDGIDSLLIDSFFSYPVQNVFEALTSQVEPNSERVDAATTAPEFSSLSAILVTHSHHDHAMDVGEVASKFSKAVVIGSKSTRNILDGWARWCGMVPGGPAYCPLMARFHEIPNLDSGRRAVHTIGSFTITILAGSHAKTLFGFLEAEQIDGPLVPPRRISNYASDDVYIVHVAHTPSTQSLVFVGSAGIPMEGVFDGLEAEVVFLAVAGMPRGDDQTRYLDRTIGALQRQPKVVVPIHWDSQFDKPQNGEVVEPSGLYALGARVGSGLESVRDYVERNLKGSKLLMLPYDERVAISKL